MNIRDLLLTYHKEYLNSMFGLCADCETDLTKIPLTRYYMLLISFDMFMAGLY